MKKSIIAAGLLALFSTTAMANETLIVGATPVPHAEILEFVKPVLAKEGVDLQIKVFNDFIQPNQQLAEKHLDANYYQYRPFLDNYNQTRHTNLIPVVGVHIEPFGAYSSKYTSLTAVPDGATIAIPNDPVNTGRALVMLSNAGLITLKDPHNPQSATKDITSNPHHFKIRELEGAMLARAVKQVDLAFIFANYALEAGIDTDKALLVEKGSDLYVEYLVARPDNIQDPGIQKLAQALHSDAVRQFILTRYQAKFYPDFNHRGQRRQPLPGQTERIIVTHIPAPPIHIEFAGISKAYPNGVQALQDIDLTIRQGEIFGIIGRSGAGKSTCCACLIAWKVPIAARCSSTASRPFATPRASCATCVGGWR